MFLLPDGEKSPVFVVIFDAAGSIGFFFRRFGQSTLSLNIAIKELILVVIAAKLWGYGRCLLFRNGLMQNRHLAFILREPTIFAITNSFTFTATRIEGLQIEELMLCLALS